MENEIIPTETAAALQTAERLNMPMMPLRGVTVYPVNISNIDVGRERSINAIEEAIDHNDDMIFLVAQKDSRVDDPDQNDLYQIGVVAKVRQYLKLPGGSVRLLAEGKFRARLTAVTGSSPFMSAEVEPLTETEGEKESVLEAYSRLMLRSFEAYVKRSPRLPSECLAPVKQAVSHSARTDAVAELLPISLAEHQQVLEETCVAKRMELVLELLSREGEILNLEQSIAEKVHQQVERSQKEYYLREQLKVIHDELGDGEDRDTEIDGYRRKMEQRGFPAEVRQKFETELKRLEKTPPLAAEGMVISNYLDTLLELPWTEKTPETRDIIKAEKILNADHFGLEKPKERILEYLAATQLKEDFNGPILCLVGPPGVGKTSLARSIARATGRKFVRMSLGGVRDEAEIRGHRRTYIGAMTGRLLANIKTAGVINPLFLLDEIDKLTSDLHGDPASALLEALDPEQNSTFSDHYLEVPYDLSHVMFVTTANYRSNIPQPLLDRMEIIEVASYTDVEKFSIAKKHLIPKQLKEHGIERRTLSISADALRAIIRSYTREAGVRELERRIAKICRRAARDIVAGDPGPFKITEKDLERYLGIPPYIDDKLLRSAKLGIATGMAWTEVGGELLQIEAVTLPGKGKFTITGQLGDVMRESVLTAYSYLRSMGKQFKIPNNVEEKTDLHLHVPEGAVPKDGPSAGVTIATALASQFSHRKVRGDIAMTGEITLHGNVLAVGGIKEKVLAAWRNGIHEIILPQSCLKDLAELPPDIREKITFHPVEHVSEVFELALLK